MLRDFLSTRWLFLLAALSLQQQGVLGAQASQVSTQASGLYRVAGIVVSKIDGHPLARVRVTLRDAKSSDKYESLVTSEDGKFEFKDVPPGKYDLNGRKHGYIVASYDQHGQFSTAIVTGAGLETESLQLRLAPAAIIYGKVLDESGEPVRHANVTIYFDDHSTGVDQIRQFRMTQTDDLGAYEIRPLMPGTYFASVTASPWYAIHPTSQGKAGSEAQVTNTDRSLDVAYPITYYSDVTDTDSATPIPVRGGERLEVDIHLNPAPSLRLLFRVPQHEKGTFVFPQLEQTTFEGSTTFVPQANSQPVSPGLVEITGVPAGYYNIRFNGPGAALQMNGVDLNKDGEEIDATKAEGLSSVKVAVQIAGEPSTPPRLWVALRGGHRGNGGAQRVTEKGEAEFHDIAPGRYEVVTFGPDRQYFIAHISADGAEVSGRAVTITPASSPRISLALASGNIGVEGVVKRTGKPFAGAMVVLVPKNPENNRDLFRRDQSDLDGTFSLRNVVPGSYTILAINDGWDLDWSQPAVISAYLKGGRSIDVGSQSGRPMNLSEAIEVQSK